MVLKYRFLGKGYTDENGVAHMTEDADGQAVAGYTGTGRGLTDVVASTDDKDNIKESSLQSETYSIWDYHFWDKGIDTDYNNTWVNDGVSVSRTSEHTALLKDGNGNFKLPSGAIPTAPFNIEFDLHSAKNSDHYIVFGRAFNTHTADIGNAHVLLEVASDYSMRLKVGETYNPTTFTFNPTETHRFKNSSTSTELQFSNFKVYQI